MFSRRSSLAANVVSAAGRDFLPSHFSQNFSYICGPRWLTPQGVRHLVMGPLIAWVRISFSPENFQIEKFVKLAELMTNLEKSAQIEQPITLVKNINEAKTK